MPANYNSAFSPVRKTTSMRVNEHQLPPDATCCNCSECGTLIVLSVPLAWLHEQPKDLKDSFATGGRLKRYSKSAVHNIRTIESFTMGHINGRPFCSVCLRSNIPSGCTKPVRNLRDDDPGQQGALRHLEDG